MNKKIKLFSTIIACLFMLLPMTVNAVDTVSTNNEGTVETVANSETRGAEQNYTISIPAETTVNPSTNKGTLNFSGEVNQYNKLNIEVSSQDGKLKNGTKTLSYLMDKSSFEYTAKEANQTFNETINLQVTETANFSGEYKDQLTFTITSTALSKPVTLDHGDGTTSTIQLVPNKKIGTLLQVLTMEGSKFMGWYTQPDGEGTQVTEETVYDGTYTQLYAKWKNLKPVLLSGYQFNQKIPAEATSIIFNHEVKPESITNYQDVSEKQDGSIIAWLDGTTWKVSTQDNDATIMANKNCLQMFYDKNSLKQIDFGNFDTSQVTDMSSMFYNCNNLTTLDVRNFNTSKVTDMRNMFESCKNLTTLNVSGFNTSKVTDMKYMFKNCNNLTILDVSNFDTSQVTNMKWMFTNCSNLTSLDVSRFNTSQVTDMDMMLYGCKSLTTLDVSGFDTSKVTNMMQMFSNCNNLTALDVSGFDTSKVTSMSAMFYGCKSLTTLDVSGFDTSQVIYIGSMFSGCNNLASLDVSGFNTSKVTSMSGMFNDCNNLTNLNISNFNTSKVTDMSSMFEGCNKLTALDVSGFDTSKVTRMAYMFRDCNKLTTLDVSGFDTSKVTDMIQMFLDCNNLTTLDVSGFDTSKVTRMVCMFSGCKNLTTLDVSGFNTSQVTDMNQMFYGCKNLTALDLSSFDFSKVTNWTNMLTLNGTADCITQVKDADIITLLKSKATPSTNVKFVLPAPILLSGREFNAKIPAEATLIIFSQKAKPEDITEYQDVSTAQNGSIIAWLQDTIWWISTQDENIEITANKDCSDMFSNQKNLKRIETLSFDTSNVTNMNNMFSNCNNLTELNLFHFDFSKVATYDNMLTLNGTNDCFVEVNGADMATLLTNKANPSNNVKLTYGVEISIKTLPNFDTQDEFLLVNKKISANVDLDYILQNIEEDALERGYVFLGWFTAETGGIEVTNDTVYDGSFNTIYAHWKKVPKLLSGYEFNQKIPTEATSIIFSHEVKPESITDYQDVSEAQDGSIIAWLDGTTWKVSTQDNDVTIMANQNCLQMFQNKQSIESIKFDNFDTSQVTNMSSMFSGCQNLTTLDVSGFDTSKVISMYSMFFRCHNLPTLDVSNFDTSNVTRMDEMFSSCSNLPTLDVSNFDTSQVTNMSFMFIGCNKLTTLDLSSFNTSKVTNMNNMFNSCNNLPTLDLSGFNTSQVTNMNNMFTNCLNLTTLDLSSFNTSKVTNMSSMFTSCNKLPTLDVSGFNTSKVTNMNNMFSNCKNLTSLDVSGFDTSQVTNMGYMFSGCNKLTTLDVSGFDTSKVTGMYGMFRACNNLTTLDLSNFNFSKVTNWNNMLNLNGTADCITQVKDADTITLLQSKASPSSNVKLVVAGSSDEAPSDTDIIPASEEVQDENQVLEPEAPETPEVEKTNISEEIPNKEEAIVPEETPSPEATADPVIRPSEKPDNNASENTTDEETVTPSPQETEVPTSEPETQESSETIDESESQN